MKRQKDSQLRCTCTYVKCMCVVVCNFIETKNENPNYEEMRLECLEVCKLYSDNRPLQVGSRVKIMLGD